MVAVQALLSGLDGAPREVSINQNLARGHATGAGDDDVDVALDCCDVAHNSMNAICGVFYSKIDRPCLFSFGCL